MNAGQKNSSLTRKKKAKRAKKQANKQTKAKQNKTGQSIIINGKKCSKKHTLTYHTIQLRSKYRQTTSLSPEGIIWPWCYSFQLRWYYIWPNTNWVYVHSNIFELRCKVSNGPPFRSLRTTSDQYSNLRENVGPFTFRQNLRLMTFALIVRKHQRCLPNY